MAAAMPAASPIPAGPPLSFRAEIEGQWDAFFGGASIPLMENPYEWWRGQLPSELGLLFQSFVGSLPSLRRMVTSSGSSASARWCSLICVQGWPSRPWRCG